MVKKKNKTLHSLQFVISGDYVILFIIETLGGWKNQLKIEADFAVIGSIYSIFVNMNKSEIFINNSSGFKLK